MFHLIGDFVRIFTSIVDVVVTFSLSEMFWPLCRKETK